MGRLRIAAIVVVLAIAGIAKLASSPGFNPDPVFPAGPISATVSHQVPQLERVASALAGRRTVVNCWSNRDWARFQAYEGEHRAAALIDALGVTWRTTRHVDLSPVVCQTLAQVLARTPREPLFTAYAVTVLAHESAHASGIDAENRAECRAIRTDERAARLLGLPEATADRLPHIYRGTVYPHDEPRYRTPVCPAGRPGKVVPDTLGTVADIRPLARVGARVVRALPGWRNVGGSLAFGPLAPCAPVRSRSDELARFGEVLVSPRGLLATYAGTSLKTGRDFAIAVRRFKELARCEVAERRVEIREFRSAATIALAPMPATIRRLSPAVKSFRVALTYKGKKIADDSIFVFDPAQHSMLEVLVEAPAGRLPVAVERRAAEALLGPEAIGG